MIYKDFKKKIQDLGFVVTDQGQYRCVERGADIFAKIDLGAENSFNTMYYGSAQIDGELFKKLLEPIIEFAATPLKKRKVETTRYMIKVEQVNYGDEFWVIDPQQCIRDVWLSIDKDSAALFSADEAEQVKGKLLSLTKYSNVTILEAE
nr:MAG TPA: hypothetical protein [Caudoviricetes sp.]